MGEPELLILDEPTSGLDPIGRHELLSLVADIRSELTIFFSSHILEDVENVCDRVVMIGRGRLLEQGELDEVLERHSSTGLTVRVRGGGDGLAAALRREDWAGDVSGTDTEVRLRAPLMARAEMELPRLVSAMGLALVGVEPSGGSLVDVYLGLTEGAGDE